MVETEGGCGAEWFANAAGADMMNGSDAAFERVETDSRSADAGALFVALKGERSDGHDYARKAADSGASAVLVSSAWWSAVGNGALAGVSCPVIVADDTLLALQKAATAWRSRFPSIMRFGVTGSAGKTSTKELLAAIVGAGRKTVKNPGNLNSDIGLAASIFLMRPEHEAAVFEMGVNRPGEMETLAGIFEPDCALITNVGTAHIGVLGGSRVAIASEKKAITSQFDGSQTLVVWEDDDFRDALRTGVRGACATYGPRSTDGFEGARDLGLDGWVLRFRGIDARLHLPGAHNLLNALGAIRAATLFGASAEDVTTGLESVLPLSGRTSVIRGDYTVVDDCYNANSEGMLAALSFCDALDASGRRVYVLGSMKEQGEQSPAAHARLGKAAAASKADILVFYGDEAKDAFEAATGSGGLADIRYFREYGDLESDIVATVRSGDLVLIKASRSLALERLTERLTGIGGVHGS